MFSESISRYTSTNFQNFLLFEKLEISTTNALLSQQLNNFHDYLIRVSQDYAEKDDLAYWYDGSLNWDRPY